MLAGKVCWPQIYANILRVSHNFLQFLTVDTPSLTPYGSPPICDILALLNQTLPWFSSVLHHGTNIFVATPSLFLHPAEIHWVKHNCKTICSFLEALRDYTFSILHGAPTCHIQLPIQLIKLFMFSSYVGFFNILLNILCTTCPINFLSFLFCALIFPEWIIGSCNLLFISIAC